MKLSITPETTIADLLAAYPHLEAVLLQQSPRFAHLRNPILRRTVAKVASLERAAQMGGIPLRQLIATLREAAGLPAADPGADGPPAETGGPAPDWLDQAKVAATIEADRLLAAGEVPLPRVHQAVRELGPGGLLRVVSSFPPAPLVEVLAKAGHSTYVVQVAPEVFHTFVRPKDFA